MNINSLIFAELIVLPIIGFLAYYLGRRKTQNPVLAGFVGAFLAIIPPLGLIYLAVLLLKKDVISSAVAARGQGGF